MNLSETTQPLELVGTGPTRRVVLTVGGGLGLATFLAACGVGGGSGASGGAGSGKGAIRALVMKQAGYSEEDIRKMTSTFQAANPDIKVTLDFVAYEALHDKTVAAAPAGTYDVVLIDVIWPAEFGTKKIVADVSSKWPASWKEQMLGGAVATPQYNSQCLWCALDPGHQVPILQHRTPGQGQGGRRAAGHMGRRAEGGSRPEGQRRHEVPTGVVLAAG